MVSININFSNKFTYLFIGIIGVLVISGFAIAYTTTGSANPSVMGHTCNEIEGGCVGGGTGGSLSCTTSTGIPVDSSGNSHCAAMGAGYVCTAVSAADMSGGTLGSSAATCVWVSTTAGTYKANCCKIA